jgi:hypothetical protein
VMIGASCTDDGQQITLGVDETGLEASCHKVPKRPCQALMSGRSTDRPRALGGTAPLGASGSQRDEHGCPSG